MRVVLIKRGNMDIEQTITMIVSFLGIGGMISGVVLRKIDKSSRDSEKRAAEREAARMKENVLILQGIHATGQLSSSTAIALKNGKCNGETEKALSRYAEFERDLDNYLLEQNALNHRR